MKENTFETIHEFLNRANTETILSIIREINGYNGSLEDMKWYDMEEFDELLEGKTPWEIARACYYGSFCPADGYFKWNGYGNLESTDFINLDDSDIQEILEAIDSIPYRYLPSDIQFIIDECENRNDEEEEEPDENGGYIIPLF